jgi:hypothetical protein
MRDSWMNVCLAAERSLAKEAVYIEELVETSTGTTMVAYTGDR